MDIDLRTNSTIGICKAYRLNLGPRWLTNTAWVHARLCKLNKEWCIRLAVASDKAYQLLAHGQWFSPGTPASSTTKTGCLNIAEILLKMELSTPPPSPLVCVFVCVCVCVCVCVLVISILPLSKIFQLTLGTVPILWYVLFSFHD